MPDLGGRDIFDMPEWPGNKAEMDDEESYVMTLQEKRAIWLFMRLAELNHIMATSGQPIANEPPPMLDEENTLYAELEALWPVINIDKLKELFS